MKEGTTLADRSASAVPSSKAVRITGLEPARDYHQNLNLARLPIPPYPLVHYNKKQPS